AMDKPHTPHTTVVPLLGSSSDHMNTTAAANAPRPKANITQAVGNRHPSLSLVIVQAARVKEPSATELDYRTPGESIGSDHPASCNGRSPSWKQAPVVCACPPRSRSDRRSTRLSTRVSG